jgi:hypothetical protein
LQGHIFDPEVKKDQKNRVFPLFSKLYPVFGIYGNLFDLITLFYTREIGFNPIFATKIQNAAVFQSFCCS